MLSVVTGWMSSEWPGFEDILCEGETLKTLWHQQHHLKSIDGVLYREQFDGTQQLIVPKKLRHRKTLRYFSQVVTLRDNWRAFGRAAYPFASAPESVLAGLVEGYRDILQIVRNLLSL